jgi:D-alanyl-D-alanine dipeptidase
MFVEFINNRNFGKLLLALCAVVAAGCATSHPFPELHPLEPSPTATAQYSRQTLEDVRSTVPDVICDLRYASSRNVAGKRVYPATMPCLLQASTVEKLRRAQLILRGQGLGLKIWDAWRPAEVQLLLHDSSSRHSHLFVDPRQAWSKHCAGMAVDVTLVDAKGKELRMPSDFDNPTAGASATYRGKDPVIWKNLAILQSTMMSAGFNPINFEWWHFDDVDFDESFPPAPIYARDLGITLP